jgi:hypothetical protein
MIDVVFITGVGCGLIFGYHLKFVIGCDAIILALLRHQHLV